MQEKSLFLPVIADGVDKSCPLKNRIRKNYRHVRKWAKRTITNCFRIYDRDIKEFPLAIDYYDGRFCVHFFSSSRDSDEPRQDLYEAAINALQDIFNATEEMIYSRMRVKRRKTQQYEKSDSIRDFFTVIEHGAYFKVNLTDYLDTGLFLDHRQTRQLVAAQAKGKRLLNLFAYTCSFSVQAAYAGAAFTKSVDMSKTYTQWGKENFAINGLSLENNPVVCADCIKFLKEAILEKETYDAIVIDPPTISRSKKMDGMFDIQCDYVLLIEKALQLLAPGGTIYFSTNSRKFTFDASLFPDCTIKDITQKTIPLDFHDRKVHRCWSISQK